MFHPLSEVRLKGGATVECGIVQPPAEAWADRVEEMLLHKGDPWNWQNSEVLGNDTVAAVKKLKSEDGPDLLTQGSTEFLKALFDNDLVDEIHVSVFPVILGKGKRLFGDAAAPTRDSVIQWDMPTTAHTNTTIHVRRPVAHLMNTPFFQLNRLSARAAKPPQRTSVN